LLLDQPFLLDLEGILDPEGSLEVVVAGVASISEDHLLVSAVDRGNSVAHVLVLVVDGVTQVHWEIAVIFLFFDDVDGVVETVGKVVFDSRADSLKVLIVMGLVLEDQIEL
jgi:hypothetical protein